MIDDNEQNIMILAQTEEDKERLFEMATIYKNFSKELNNKNLNGEKKRLQIYIVSKELIDNIKNAIKYEELKELFTDNNNQKKENLKKFKENIKDLNYYDIDVILSLEIKLYSNAEEMQDDIEIGFEYVNSEFLDKLEVEEELNDYIANYYRSNDNICIEFDDKSKLLINEENGKIKYHAMDAPLEKKEGVEVKVKRTKTLSRVLTKRCKTKRARSKTIKE